MDQHKNTFLDFISKLNLKDFDCMWPPQTNEYIWKDSLFIINNYPQDKLYRHFYIKYNQIKGNLYPQYFLNSLDKSNTQILIDYYNHPNQ